MVETVAPVATAAPPTTSGAQPEIPADKAAAHDKRHRVRLIIFFSSFFLNSFPTRSEELRDVKRRTASAGRFPARLHLQEGLQPCFVFL